jgi:hypothetical protein
MPGIRGGKRKVRYGLSPAKTPKMLPEPTEEANIPLMQPNGSVKYVTREDFQWLIDNRKIDMPLPTPTPTEEAPKSQK